MHGLLFKKIKKVKIVHLLVLSIIAVPLVSLAAAMSSSNYTIESDSINVGGSLGSSANYILEDTLGEIATGISTSTNYIVGAGYQQMDSSFISVSIGGAISMSSMGGIANATSTGATNITVITDSPSGYALSVKATSSPAMIAVGGYSFDDYTEVGNPDFNFTIASTVSEFGYTSEGDDIVSKFKDNGSVCNTGVSDSADTCWVGFSTTDSVIAQKTSANHPYGTVTGLGLKAANGGSHIQEAATYTATIVVTAIAL